MPLMFVEVFDYNISIRAKFKLYYGFNVTNAAQYLAQLPTSPVTLQLDMQGEYAMRQYDTNYNISFSNNNAQV